MFIMENGEITANTSTSGSTYAGVGVYVNGRGDTPGRFQLSGGRITGNKNSNAADSNVWLRSDSNNCFIELTGPLAEGTSVGVTLENEGVFTTGWKEYMDGKDPKAYFASDVSQYGVTTDDSGEAALSADAAHIPGDINGDGKVNNRDLTRLAQYLAGKNVDYVEGSLDVNGDGKVNNRDLTRLAQHLAGKVVELH